MNLMIDIETLDTKVNAVILSVGICAFDMDGIHDKKGFTLEVEEQLEKGRTISFDTLEWWFRQSKEAQQGAFNRLDRVSVKDFLNQLGYFCSKNNINNVYAQGSDFDLPKITSLHEQYNHEMPWDFFLALDTRTVYKFMDVQKPERQGTHHDAVDDVVYQAECVILALKEQQRRRG